MKKILAAIAALSLVFSLASCSSTTESKVEHEYVTTRLSVASYKKEALTTPEEMKQVYSFMPYNSVNDYLLLGFSTRCPEFWHANADFSQYELVEFPEFDIGANYVIDTANDGTVVTFVIHADYGDLPPIELYQILDQDEQEKYDAAAEYKFIIRTYSPDGKLLNTVDVEDFGVEPNKTVSLGGMWSDGKIVIVKVGGGFEAFAIDGKHIGELTTPDGDVDAVGHTSDGGLICAVSFKDGDTEKLKLCRIAEDGKITDFNGCVYEYNEMIKEILPGKGKYSNIIVTRTAIFGVDAENGEMIHKLDITASGINFDWIEGVYITDDDYVAMMSNESMGFAVNFKKYIPRSDEEMANIPILTLGVNGSDYRLNEYVTEWNDSGHDFMLQILENYGSSDDDSPTDLDELKQAALKGELPDMMMVRGNGQYDDLDLAGLGALCDLYEFIDSDSEISRDTFVPNVLSCFEQDGKLCCMPNRITLDLGKVCKKKFVDSADGWDRKAAVDYCFEGDTSKILWFDDAKKTRFYNTYHVNFMQWVDFDNATCDFDDEDFIRFLKWCNEAEDIEYVDDGSQKPYDEMTDEDHAKIYIDQQTEYLEDRRIFNDVGLVCYKNYPEMTRGTFGGEELTFLEEPEILCSETYAITANSDKKELAWEFIKSMISDEKYSSETNEQTFMGEFPVTKVGLKMMSDYEQTHYEDFSQYTEMNNYDEWKDYKGLTYEIGWADRSNAIKLGELSDEDVAAVNDFISRAKPANYGVYPGENFYEIVEEETMRYFSGECTAEDCAKVLQSRMSIYLSEQFGN